MMDTDGPVNSAFSSALHKLSLIVLDNLQNKSFGCGRKLCFRFL